MGVPSTVHRVVTSVADLKGVEPTDLEPIGETLDADALDAIFPASADGHRTLRFTYEGCRVELAHDGQVSVEPADDGVENGLHDTEASDNE